MALDLDGLRKRFAELGVGELLIKPLAPNDNSKNQPYIAKDRSMQGFNLLPASDFESVGRNMRAKLDLRWIDSDGAIHPAPHAKLIQYTRYSPPEVRLSGFLKGCAGAPSELMNSRLEGRYLFLGVAGRQVFAYAAGPDDAISTAAQVIIASDGIERRGVLYAVSLADPEQPITASIESELQRVQNMGWVSGQKRAGGIVVPYTGSNAGGMTLESLLGVDANSKTEPDFLGWELKAVLTTTPSELPRSKVATLITPSPTGGYYGEHGFESFIRRYGYPAQDGTPDRINFGGVHRVGLMAPKTGSVLQLTGYQSGDGVVSGGSIDLIMNDGDLGAAWPFEGLLEKWNRKHAQTVYVPYQRDGNRYRYFSEALYCRGSDFGRFLAALSDQVAYYDPGLKMENATTSCRPSKARHQFRTNLRDIARLYISSGRAKPS